MNIFDSHQACADFENRHRDYFNGVPEMLVLCRNIGETLVIQNTPDTLTRIKVVRTERPMVILSVETHTLDGKLRERTELHLPESA